jgi:hypothetical protein
MQPTNADRVLLRQRTLSDGELRNVATNPGHSTWLCAVDTEPRELDRLHGEGALVEAAQAQGNALCRSGAAADMTHR